MSPNLGDWIHSFAITDAIKHRRGYTVYKITSIVFPRSVPQARTTVTVWKRFHDIRKLYRELCRRAKSTHIHANIPKPLVGNFLNRFDTHIIQKRKEYILQLLDFVALHPVLYKCHAFIQFLKEGQSPDTSPRHHATPIKSGNTTQDNANVVIGDTGDSYDPQHDNGNGNGSVSASAFDNNSDNIANVLCMSEAISDDFMVDAYRDKPLGTNYSMLSSMLSIENDDSDYIYEAALEFSKAVQSEANFEYRQAYETYKRGIDILTTGCEDDTNESRKFIAKSKIFKYKTRANDIYENYIDGVNDAKGNIDGDGDGDGDSRFCVDCRADTHTLCAVTELPWNDLRNYKVLRVLGNRVMQVCDIAKTHRPTFIMKGIERPATTGVRSHVTRLFLPKVVPYMVQLVAFFQSEHKIFLLLEHAKVGRLYDYIASYEPKMERTNNLEQLFTDIDDGTEQNDGQLAMPTDSMDPMELVRYSQKLLQSVTNTLKLSKELQDAPTTADDGIRCVETTTPEKMAKALSGQRLPEACIKDWASELVVAIHSLHSHGVVLGDLHMNNLLLGSRGQLLLTYFYQLDSSASDNCGSKMFSPFALAGHYVAPERPLTAKSDWWSYGVIMYQMLFGFSFKDAHPGHIDLYNCVQYPENVNIFDNGLDLLDNVLKMTPDERFDYDQIQGHAFFAGTDWADVLRRDVATCRRATNL